jgi:hypothetical protein
MLTRPVLLPQILDHLALLRGEALPEDWHRRGGNTQRQQSWLDSQLCLRCKDFNCPMHGACYWLWD